ncbi:MAG: PilN domain-containing protein [bacterium]
MITLNLISPEYKKTIKIKKILRDGRNVFSYTMFIVILAAIILLIAKRLLDDNYFEAVEQATLISQNPTENKTNKEINKKIKLAWQAQQDYMPWSRLIIMISKLVPDNVTIESFNVNSDVNKTEYKISLSGVAASRNDFLDFKKNLLEAKDLFEEKDIEIPLANLVEKEDIKFDIILKIKKEILANLKMPDSH